MTPDALWLATRRSAVITELMSKLNRLAATRDIAVVLISQTSVKVRSEMGAVLRPAMWGRDWGEGVRNGVVVFRDFMPRGKGGENRGKGAVRFAAVVKVGGRERRRMQVVVPFVIEDVSSFSFLSFPFLSLPGWWAGYVCLIIILAYLW